jgi:hypothetical protein
VTPQQLYNELNYVNHSREKRQYYANLVIDNTDLVPLLLDILFQVNDPISCRAAWVFEFMCSKKLEASLPYLDTFTNQLHTVHRDSAIRPVAKVCEYLVTTYYNQPQSQVRQKLTESHKEKIIASCFDWMINENKVAPKAYAMNCLFLLGSDNTWIHPELRGILERDYQMQSSGFKARARHILKKI